MPGFIESHGVLFAAAKPKYSAVAYPKSAYFRLRAPTFGGGGGGGDDAVAIVISAQARPQRVYISVGNQDVAIVLYLRGGHSKRLK